LEGEDVLLAGTEIRTSLFLLISGLDSFADGGKQETLIPIIDLTPLTVAPKILPPQSAQLTNESLRFWSGVTEAITARQFSRATTLKQELEERQRAKAKEREESGVEWQPRFFVGAVTPLGRPELSEDGKEVLKGLQGDVWELRESEVLGA
jgi:hypothetical protein